MQESLYQENLGVHYEVVVLIGKDLESWAYLKMSISNIGA